MFKKLLSLSLAAGALTLASCSLSEPDEVSGNADDLRFTGYTCYGVKMMSVDYDAEGRVTEIKFGNEMTYTLTYAGNSVVPTTIVCEEYDYRYEGDSDNATRYVSERSTWYEIEPWQNNKYIGYFKVKNEYPDGYGETTVGTMRFEYNDNHVTKEIITETTNGVYDTDTRTFIWKNGLLTEWQDGEHSERAEYGYSDVENTVGQWDPNNGALGPLAITGLLGEAPARFMKWEKQYNDGKIDAVQQHAYVLMDNGLIKMAKLSGDEDDSDVAMVFNFQYEKK